MLVSAARRFLPGFDRPGKTSSVPGHQESMTVHQIQGSSPCAGSGPAVDVRTWRRCRLLEAGFPKSQAQWVAADPRFDLHALLELVDPGCPPPLAVRILAPESRESAS